MASCFLPPSSAHGGQQLQRGPVNHLGQQHGTPGRGADPEDLGAAGNAVDAVDDVVQARGEEVDVLAIERGDERTIEADRDVVRQLVRLELEPADRLDQVGPAIPVGAEQFAELPRGIDAALRDLGEELEELLVPREQAHQADLDSMRMP